MSRRTKLILASIVLVVGGGLAWQFRNHGEQSSGAGDQSAPFATLGHVGDANPMAESKPSPTSFGQAGAWLPPAGNSASLQPAAVPVAAEKTAPATAIQSATTGPKSGVADDGGVPELSKAYTGVAGRDARSPTPIGAPRDDSSFDRGPRLDELGDSRLGPTHKVADGDTLPQLAQRYLGSAERWRELYSFNRDVLTNPDLLPIGAELRIPMLPFPTAQQNVALQAGPPANSDQAATAPAGPPPIAQTVSQSLAAPVTSPQPTDGNLVPVPVAASGSAPAPSNGQSPVKFQRLPPVGPVGKVLRVAPRTYTVLPGDTLNSIAEKLYGDGGRETVLLQANQNLLPTAADIRPGMILVVPLDPRE